MTLWHKSPMLPLLIVVVSLVMVLGWISTLPMKTEYESIVLAQGYFEDDAAVETIESIQSRQFTPFSGPLFLGNNKRPLWIKLQLATSEFNDWVLVIEPNHTHHIELWTLSSLGWTQQVVGIKHPFANREIATLAPSIPLNVSFETQTEVFVKIQTPSTPVAVRVLRLNDNANYNAIMHLVVGSLLGVGLLIGGISLLMFLATKDCLWAFDAGLNLIGLFVLSTQLGLTASLFFQAAGTGMASTILYLNAFYMIYTIYFYTRLFRLFTLPVWVLKPYTIIFIVFPVIPLLIFFNHGDIAMQLNNTVIGLVTLWGLVVVICSRHQDLLMRWVFAIGYGMVNVYFFVWALPIIFEKQTGNLFALYPSLPVNLFSMLLMVLILARNTQLKLLENQRLAEEKEAAELTLRQAQQHHEETSSFFSMLMHEVKNPLSVIRMTTVNLASDLSREMTNVPEPIEMRMARLQQAVTHVDNVLERGVEVDQLVQGALQVQPKTLDVAAWLANWCRQQPAAERINYVTDVSLTTQVDVELLELMTQNLIDNALKYAAPDSIITCTLQRDHDCWGLSVRNTTGAIGFPDPARLFSKYYRASAAMHLGGFGLGLYWVRGVARRLGGDVNYEANQQDVIFTLWLPN